VQLIFMTGDAMARPLIEEFERKAATGTPYDASSLFVISSSAAIFSPQVKERWMAAFPDGIFTDSVGASETGFQGMGMQDKEHISSDGPVVGLGPNSVVIDEDNRILELEPNVGKVGRLGRGGSVPVGYYKDPEKSAATFLEIDGQRYSVPGDYARIETEGKVTLLGRGSNCVNTGGEKVYPEEVEMAIKAHPAVYDCLVVGIPDEKYGQAVAAVVELREGETLELEELREFLRASLSGYKLPRALTLVPEVPRNATGKAQYPKAKEMALAGAVQGASA
jgi:acyl-CoA synthetase (AMP-forming)/AMP-acid ligase II